MLKTVGNPSTRYGDQTITDGNLVIGTAGKGIDFSINPAAPGVTSELFDDYEEGTFTPALAFGGLSTGITYNTVTGRYTIIGNRIYLFVYVRLTNKGTATGNATITGLPVVPIAGTAFNSFSSWCNSMSFTGALQCYAAPGSANLAVQNLNAGTAANLADTSFTNTSTISLSGFYEIA